MAPGADLRSPVVIAPPTAQPPPEPPADFRRAVAALLAVQPRPELAIGELDAPSRLAPFSFALSGEGPGDTTGRLVLLHDPAAPAGWEGTFRLVCYLQAELDAGHAGDELLPAVAWSWLTEALADNGAQHRALGGTVTQARSVRFGEIGGPTRADDVELRASWTPLGDDLQRHAEAFVDLLAMAAGLPPVGVVGLTPPRM